MSALLATSPLSAHDNHQITKSVATLTKHIMSRKLPHKLMTQARYCTIAVNLLPSSIVLVTLGITPTDTVSNFFAWTPSRSVEGLFRVPYSCIPLLKAGNDGSIPTLR